MSGFHIHVIFFFAITKKIFANPWNYDPYFADSLTFGIGVTEGVRSAWERNHPNVEDYDVYAKNTEKRGTEFTTMDDNATMVEPSVNHNVESWSLVLYLVCFLVLVIFFLVISTMEVCCKKGTSNSTPEDARSEVSPPPYDQFAPPSYETLYEGNRQGKTSDKSKLSIFVIHLPKLTFDSFGGFSGAAGVRRDVNPPPPP